MMFLNQRLQNLAQMQKNAVLTCYEQLFDPKPENLAQQLTMLQQQFPNDPCSKASYTTWRKAAADFVGHMTAVWEAQKSDRLPPPSKKKNKKRNHTALVTLTSLQHLEETREKRLQGQDNPETAYTQRAVFQLTQRQIEILLSLDTEKPHPVWEQQHPLVRALLKKKLQNIIEEHEGQPEDVRNAQLSQHFGILNTTLRGWALSNAYEHEFTLKLPENDATQPLRHISHAFPIPAAQFLNTMDGQEITELYVQQWRQALEHEVAHRVEHDTLGDPDEKGCVPLTVLLASYITDAPFKVHEYQQVALKKMMVAHLEEELRTHPLTTPSGLTVTPCFIENNRSVDLSSAFTPPAGCEALLLRRPLLSLLEIELQEDYRASVAAAQKEHHTSLLGQCVATFLNALFPRKKNPALYVAALERVLLGLQGGISIGGCHSAKDRETAVRTLEHAMVLFINKKSKAPRWGNQDDQQQLNALWAQTLMDSMHTDIPANNAPGVSGMKHLSFYLPQGVLQALKNSNRWEDFCETEKSSHLSNHKPGHELLNFQHTAAKRWLMRCVALVLAPVILLVLVPAVAYKNHQGRKNGALGQPNIPEPTTQVPAHHADTAPITLQPQPFLDPPPSNPDASKRFRPS